MDGHGHGTHVSGTIAAAGNNSKGIIGVASKAKIMAVKGLTDLGGGNSEGLAQALVYAASNGADAINNSWGCTRRCPKDPVVDEAVRTAYNLGALTVFAAGNSNDNVIYYSPQNIIGSKPIVVGSSDHNDNKSDFSNYGALIDIVAPGGDSTNDSPNQIYANILSLRAYNTDMYGDGKHIVNTNYYRARGTSMAAPHISGAAALITALHPEFSLEQIRQALRAGANDIFTPGFDSFSGAGRLNLPKALNISSPLEVQIISPQIKILTGLKQVEIRGTANGAGFTNWRLDFADGEILGGERLWTLIASSQTPIKQELLAVWNITNINDGSYIIRLRAQNSSGEVYEDYINVIIDQIEIIEPAPMGFFEVPPVYRGDKKIIIKGTVAPVDFSKYEFQIIQIQPDKSEILLENPKINLTNKGRKKVYNNVLGEWNPAGIPPSHYRINLIVNGYIKEGVGVIVDSTLHKGWPQDIGSDEGSVMLAVINHIDVFDIDKDKDKDIIVGYGNDVKIFDHTGNMLPGWPQTIDSDNLGNVLIQSSPAVGDLDNDNLPEIAATNNNNQIFVWKNNGELLPGWPKYMGGTINLLSIDDINEDGANEIIAADWSGQLKVFDKQGNFLPGWPISLTAESILLPPVVGDIDGDGMKEIAAISLLGPSNLYLIDYNGNILPGWPKAINPNILAPYGSWSYPVFGDIDNNGDLEVVVGSSDGNVHVYNHDGTNLTGWPQKRGDSVSYPSIGDLDNDGKLEVVAGGDWSKLPDDSIVNYLFAWRGNGSVLPNWPIVFPQSAVNVTWGLYTPTLADIDNDGIADIIMGTEESNSRYPFTIQAYKNNTEKVAGFPRPTVSSFSSSSNNSAVDDIDNDGLLEVVWIDASGKLYVWDLSSSANGNLQWPMFRHDAQHTGNYNFVKETSTTTPPLVIIIPKDGDIIVSNSKITITAEVSGEIKDKTKRVEFYVNGVKKCQDAKTPYTCNWKVPKQPGATYKLQAKAFDKAKKGNIIAESDIITVTAK